MKRTTAVTKFIIQKLIEFGRDQSARALTTREIHGALVQHGALDPTYVSVATVCTVLKNYVTGWTYFNKVGTEYCWIPDQHRDIMMQARTPMTMIQRLDDIEARLTALEGQWKNFAK